MQYKYICIDIGGTNVRYAIYNDLNHKDIGCEI